MPDSLSGNRTRFRFVFGVPFGETHTKTFNHLIERITKVTAGCTVIDARGIWREDGNGNPPYIGDIDDEHSIIIEFVTGRFDVLRHVKRIVREVHREFDPPFRWVNVEMSSVHVDHFDASEPPTSGDSVPSGDVDVEPSGDAVPDDPRTRAMSGRARVARSTRKPGDGPHGY